jgi:hypothetical protein
LEQFILAQKESVFASFVVGHGGRAVSQVEVYVFEVVGAHVFIGDEVDTGVLVYCLANCVNVG